VCPAGDPRARTRHRRRGGTRRVCVFLRNGDLDTALQQTIAPEKLARVSAYNWMGAMAFLPAGYAIAGPVASVIGMSTSLWIGVVWVVVTTLIVISVRDVRDFRLEAVALPEPELAAGVG